MKNSAKARTLLLSEAQAHPAQQVVQGHTVLELAENQGEKALRTRNPQESATCILWNFYFVIDN